MSSPAPLTVAVITFNEEDNLSRCLNSVAWAEERVVVDCGSTDRTCELARACGARVLERPWSGYAEQKNFAVEQARHDWVLSLDADEWLSQQGAQELRQALVAPTADAFAFNRLNAFCGEFVEHAWSPDWQVRLFRKSRGQFSGGHVHESVRLEPGATVHRLSQRLLHAPYPSIEAYIERLNRYTSLAAQTLVERNQEPSVSRLLLSPMAAFFKHFVVRQGFRDGVRGLVVSSGSAFYVFVKYAKLWERRSAQEAEPLSRTASDGVEPRGTR